MRVSITTPRKTGGTAPRPGGPRVVPVDHHSLAPGFVVLEAIWKQTDLERNIRYRVLEFSSEKRYGSGCSLRRCLRAETNRPGRDGTALRGARNVPGGWMPVSP